MAEEGHKQRRRVPLLHQILQVEQLGHPAIAAKAGMQVPDVEMNGCRLEKVVHLIFPIDKFHKPFHILRKLLIGQAHVFHRLPHIDGAPNLPLLCKHGVNVHVVNDNINDHWSPFGTGDLLQRASRAAEKFNQVDERALAQCLPLVTGGIQPLSWEGELLWPRIGDLADFLLVPVKSAAHAVARVPQERIVVFRGEVVSQE